MPLQRRPHNQASAWLLAALAAVTMPACSGVVIPEPLVPEYVDCTVYPDSRTADYVLPWPVGTEFQVSRTFGHYTPANEGVGLYAIDILMPIGTAIHAARSGVVVAVQDGFTDEDRSKFHENWIMVRHADSSVARYMHLTKDGALVSVGDTVEQGQRIGLSGNSGPSTAPHLHIDVQACGPNLPPRYNDLPCGMTVPLSFANTSRESCGLRPGKRYRAQAYRREAF